MATGDIDGDGDLDLMVTRGLRASEQQIWLHRNLGEGVLDAGALVHNALRASGLALGDLDRDGDLDLVISNFAGPSVVLRNDNTGGFTVWTTVGDGASLGHGAKALALGDLNGDGLLDLALASATGQNMIYWNRGASLFVTGIPVGGIEFTESVAVGDLNSDGALDLVFGNANDPVGAQNSYYLNDGAGQEFTGESFGSVLATRSIPLGDFDGDGLLDLIVGNTGAEDELYLNQAQGRSACTAVWQTPHRLCAPDSRATQVRRRFMRWPQCYKRR
jgi:hypothetical protein